MIRNLVQSKSSVWKEDLDACYDNIDEVAEFFAGNREWGKGYNDIDFEDKTYQTLTEWFKKVADKIGALDYKKSNKTGVKI